MIEMRRGSKRALAIAADAGISLAGRVLLRRREGGTIPERPRVLLVRCDHIGDAAMATAVLQPLREALDPARLDVLVAPWAAQIYRDHPLVDDVLECAAPWWLAARGAGARARLAAWRGLPAVVGAIRSRRYDVGIEPRGDLRQILAFLALGGCVERVGTDRTGGRPLLTRAWPYREEGHEVEKSLEVVRLVGAKAAGRARLSPPRAAPLSPPVERALESVDAPGGWVALSTRGNLPSKSWPTAAAREFVAAAVEELGVAVLFVGGSRDHDAGEEVRAAAPEAVVNLAGRCSLAESLSVLRAARAAVCVDSGPMHLAALVGTPVVALFGPTPPERYAPWTDRRVVLRATGCTCRWQRCERSPGGESDCLRALPTTTVVQALRQLLAARRAHDTPFEPSSSPRAHPSLGEGSTSEPLAGRGGRVRSQLPASTAVDGDPLCVHDE